MSETETAPEVAKVFKCTDCARPFRYGELVMRPHGSKKILCKSCTKINGYKSAEAVVFGNVPASVVGRERAARNLKKLARMQKRR